MITFERFTLENGLKVLLHRDPSTPLAAMNLLYSVGARDEHPEHTGFAHLFEHLMFGGSAHIPKYDEPLEKVGGENNAFTNNDFTNYYLTLPANNLETAFWLESDRMYDLAFNEKSLEVQKSVVIEEFKQRYLNQPYGDVWLLLRPVAYTQHPYQWSTIGKEIAHIEKADMDAVREFYHTFYNPDNAILSIGGNINLEQTRHLTEKWFGPIQGCSQYQRDLPQEPKQCQARHLEVSRQVPVDALYKAYHMCPRKHPDYHAHDLLSDILANGDSSRLHQELVKNKKLFSDINAYITGDMDAGLFIISGKLAKGVKMKTADRAVEELLETICSQLVNESELEKVKNKAESLLVFSELKINDKAMNLCYYEMLGDANLCNSEANRYRAVNREQLRRVAGQLLRPSNCSTLYYFAQNQSAL